MKETQEQWIQRKESEVNREILFTGSRFGVSSLHDQNGIFLGYSIYDSQTGHLKWYEAKSDTGKTVCELVADMLGKIKDARAKVETIKSELEAIRKSGDAGVY